MAFIFLPGQYIIQPTADIFTFEHVISSQLWVLRDGEDNDEIKVITMIWKHVQAVEWMEGTKQNKTFFL